tara:strand:- start:1685 stop:1996 length:312 start_codon:yes stop_codon:yes gene_type:complete
MDSGAAKIMLLDSRESTEPNLYVISLDDAPRHMKRMIARSATKCFEHIMEDGASAMADLVDEEHDLAEERTVEIFEYFEEHCIQENKYKPGMTADVYISIAAC